MTNRIGFPGNFVTLVVEVSSFPSLVILIMS